MSEIEQAYQQLRKELPGRDIAEIEIEARRDAHECANNPYQPGTFAHLVFTHEKTKMRFPNGL